jgi:hypothetical protein
MHERQRNQIFIPKATHIHERTHPTQTQIHTHTYVRTYTYTYTPHTQTHTHTHTNTPTHQHTHTRTHTHTQTHTQTHTNTHKHTHTHTASTQRPFGVALLEPTVTSAQRSEYENWGCTSVPHFLHPLSDLVLHLHPQRPPTLLLLLGDSSFLPRGV